MAMSAQQELERNERDAQVIEYKTRGMSFRQIAGLGIPGVSSASQAHTCFHRGMENIAAIPAEEYRKLENEKLDHVERRTVALLISDDTGTNAKLKAAQVLINLSKRRSDLNGLDMPTKVEHSGMVPSILLDPDRLPDATVAALQAQATARADEAEAGLHE